MKFYPDIDGFFY